MSKKPDNKKRKFDAIKTEDAQEVPPADAIRANSMFGPRAKRQATENAMAERRQTRSMTQATTSSTSSAPVPQVKRF